MISEILKKQSKKILTYTYNSAISIPTYNENFYLTIAELFKSGL